MTVGQKIQKLRKNANLSQEDLAEKLLVSRQTVSLWETDQTLPTIDNLRLLKEIFHVSIDELLCEEEKNELEEGTASDAEEKDEFEYSFTLTDDERIKKINKGLMFAFLEKKIWLFAIIAVVIVLGIIGKAQAKQLTLPVLTMLIVSIVAVRSAIQINKGNKNSIDVLKRTFYKYRFTESGLECAVFLENAEFVRKTFQKSEIKIVYETDGILMIVLNKDKQGFIIDKLSPECDGRLLSFVTEFQKIKNIDKEHNLVSTFSKLFVIFSVISPIIGLGLMVSFAPKVDKTSIETAIATVTNQIKYSWAFYLMLPVTVGEIVFGAIFKRRGHKLTHNIVIGAITTFLCLIYGSFFIFFGLA